MAHAQKPDFIFLRKGRVHLNRRGLHFSRLLAAELCTSAVVMLDTPCSEVVWRVLATHSIRQFPLHFPSLASPYTITFQLDPTSIPFSTFSSKTVSLITYLSCRWHTSGNRAATCVKYEKAICFRGRHFTHTHTHTHTHTIISLKRSPIAYIQLRATCTWEKGV